MNSNGTHRTITNQKAARYLGVRHAHAHPIGDDTFGRSPQLTKTLKQLLTSDQTEVCSLLGFALYPDTTTVRRVMAMFTRIIRNMLKSLSKKEKTWKPNKTTGCVDPNVTPKATQLVFMGRL